MAITSSQTDVFYSKSITGNIKRRRASCTAMRTLDLQLCLKSSTDAYSILCDALNEDILSKDWISSVHLTG